MENMMKTMREHFPARTVVIEQSLDMFGIKRNEDGTLLLDELHQFFDSREKQ
ncbi:hypothetical protein LBG40_004309 [Salmonella enterica]|nr:hypothetical protein [Salmonella enterica]EDT0433691.1 hypothetical protein [Salmonella enterica]EDW6559517.1 hypothetical protein [Salmonella enterica]EFR0688409.1 hypothetical protein [Salmonella enterica]EFS6516464.1 hypothetical protein [Salmonella enterica]